MDCRTAFVAASLVVTGALGASCGTQPRSSTANRDAVTTVATSSSSAPLSDEGPATGEMGAEGDGDDPAPAPSTPRTPGGLRGEGERELAAMRSSSYAHRTDVDESTGRFNYDCSGFISYAMRRADPTAYAALRSFATRRPRAKDFVEWIDALGPTPRSTWTRIPDVAKLAPGDIVAWLKPASIVSRNTGHVMMVDAPPRPRSDREWAVPILDSSASPHGAGDTREPLHASGLGRGTIVLVVDASGLPLAYRWSEGPHSMRYETAIALGRINAE